MMKGKKIARRKYKYINGTKGVISLFMAMLLVPATILTGSLITAARVNSAVAIFDEALCNASNSTLGTYDSFLRERFGLLAMSQEITGDAEGLDQYSVSNVISETFQYYMEQNVGVLSNTYITSQTTSMGVYPLADENVLLSQVLEYSKYSVPVKLVKEGLNLEDLLNDLIKCIPGAAWLDVITAGVGVFDSVATVGVEFDKLKTAINEQQTADSNYVTSYTNFSNTIVSYIDKKAEMESVLPSLESNISTLESELEALKPAEGEEESDAYKEKQTELQTAKTNYQDTKALYETELATLKNEAKNNKTSYSQAISTLCDKLGKVKDSLVSTQQSIINVGSSVVETTSAYVDAKVSDAHKESNEKIEELEEKKNKETDEKRKGELQKQITTLKDQKTDLSNQKDIIKAEGEGVKAAMDSVKDSISNFDPVIYDTVITKLQAVKEKVDAYNTDTISTKVSAPDYYCTVADVLTLETVIAAEANIVAECYEASAWKVIKQVVAFIKALFDIAVVYKPELAAVIDTGYYKDNYGGLPSEIDRTIHPLNYGVESDAEKSKEFKELLGFFEADAPLLDTDTDIFTILGNIISNLSIIIGCITSLSNPVTATITLLFLGDTLKTIGNACTAIVDNIKLVVTSFSNIINNTKNKILLSGYISYTTSNRTTYKGESLTGASFNLRGQKECGLRDVGDVVEGVTGIYGFEELFALISSVAKGVSGGGEKCFVGAETEYIIFGNSSELINQAAMFGSIFLIRAIMNIPMVMTNPEVQSIAACFTVGAPVVWLVYSLIEGLVDTIILVNDETVPLIKNFAYLTPSGLKTLISKFSSMGLKTSTLEEVKEDYQNAIGASKADIDLSKNAEEEESFLDLTYQRMLFILLTVGVSKDTMINRFANIVQMEGVENTINKKGKDAQYNLDYSYTTIRTEGSFTTNEFIKMSETGLLTSKTRILYKGY